MNTHTKGKWEVSRDGKCVVEAGENVVAQCDFESDTKQIVHEHNNFDKLEKRIEELEDEIESLRWLQT